MNISEMDYKIKDDPNLCINTLGNFEIKYNGSSILNEKGRSYKIWELFNYMLLKRNQNITYDKIIENLMITKNYDDPKNVLKAQIHRLKNALKEIDGGRFFDIKYHDGFYTFSITVPLILDVETFEKLCMEYGSLQHISLEQKLSICNKILSVYRGEYLSGFEFESWVIPVRNYYHSMFLNCTHEMLKLLKPRGMHEEIAGICERAILVEPCDDMINASLLESYNSMGKYKKAEEYYGYIAGKYYRELGIRPSKNIQMIYKQIKSAGNYKYPVYNDEIKDVFEGPVYCSNDIFRYIYNIEKIRKVCSNTLCIITVQYPDLSYIPSDILIPFMENIKKILMQKLRKSDVFTQWNETQIYILLLGNQDEIKSLFNTRISKKLNDECIKHSLTLKLIFETL